MKYFFIVLVFIFLNDEIFAQIGGISNSKLNSICVDIIGRHNIEFEPGFYYSTSNKFWDNNNHLSNTFNSNDSISNSSGMQFRFTYGLFDKLEVGVTVPGSVTTSNWGVKYIIFQNDILGFAVIGGVDIPFGNNKQDKNIKTEENTIQAGFGAVLSYQQNDNLSFDFNAQYNNYINKLENSKSNSIYLSADAGYYVFSHSLQVIAGLGYRHHNFDFMDQSLITFYPGVTIETGKNYVIILTTPFDIYGKNIEKTFNLGFALTLTIG